ncbi:MAG: isoprenyl transferase [Flavobacteriales bacterium]|nr:isoprenyl transferase [Flavobacteriales bacterium]|tara:strand:- start:21199 stop:21921 length:723 start_codon:yes stop_codon:yes gene_type:complete
MTQIDQKYLPKHIAITMDGNGRWAKSKGKIRMFGHNHAIEAVRDTVEAAAEIGIEFLTLYAFSTENWRRPKTEVNALMNLLVSAINKETKTLMKNNIQLNTIGDTNSLPDKAKKELLAAIERTKNNTRMTLTLALSYSGRWDIVNATKNMLLENISPSIINEDLFEQYLTTNNVPDPELLIRTSGEYRISNFLLWQIAYSELFFTETLWPDFRRNNLEDAILDYQKRERRFGRTTEQLED